MRRPASVTLVGSLQSELGCPDDWSPPCPATALQPADDGAWSLTVDVPAGSWEWKVALDGDMGPQLPVGQRAVGAGGPTRLTFSYDDTSHRVAVGPAEPPAGVTEADRQLAGTSLRDDLTRERFYFVMADRFENGDPTNDTGGHRGGPVGQRLRPDRQGLLPRRRHRRSGVAARLHRGPRHDCDLADAGVQEPARAGVGRRHQRRLPRLLDHRLHPDRPPPRHQRRPAHARRRGPRRVASRSSSTSSPTTRPT